MTHLVKSILDRRVEMRAEQAMLVGISGIDASGKGYVAKHLAAGLESCGHSVALINADAWLNLPHIRFLDQKALALERSTYFYHHAIRLPEMFETLILPLKQNRKVDLAMDLVEETAIEYRPHIYQFGNIDIILLEGIFIFKKAFAPLFDLKIWIDCSFETALGRAKKRGQEGLSPNATIAAYEELYFPAQRLHFKIDDPRQDADLKFGND